MRSHQKLWTAAAIFWMLFIWSNSLQTAVQSASNSLKTLELLMPLLEWTMIPEEIWHTVIRKSAHMAEFALLGVLWNAALNMVYKAEFRFIWKRVSVVLAVCLLTAITDETIQLFVPGRSGEIRDVCIDFGGALAGCAMFALIAQIKRNAKQPDAVDVFER